MHTYNYYFPNSPKLGQREYRFGLRTLEISNPARQPMGISEVSIDGESDSSTNHLQRAIPTLPLPPFTYATPPKHLGGL